MMQDYVKVPRTPFFSSPPPIPEPHLPIPKTGLVNRLNCNFIPSELNVKFNLNLVFKSKASTSTGPKASNHRFPFNLKSTIRIACHDLKVKAKKKLGRKPSTPQPKIKKIVETKPLVSVQTRNKIASKACTTRDRYSILFKVKKHQFKSSVRSVKSSLKSSFKSHSAVTNVCADSQPQKWSPIPLWDVRPQLGIHETNNDTAMVTVTGGVQGLATPELNSRSVDAVVVGVDDNCGNETSSDICNRSFELNELGESFVPVKRYYLDSLVNVDLDNLDRDRFSFEYTMRSTSSYYSDDDSFITASDKPMVNNQPIYEPSTGIPNLTGFHVPPGLIFMPETPGMIVGMPLDYYENPEPSDEESDRASTIILDPEQVSVPESSVSESSSLSETPPSPNSSSLPNPVLPDIHSFSNLQELSGQAWADFESSSEDQSLSEPQLPSEPEPEPEPKPQPLFIRKRSILRRGDVIVPRQELPVYHKGALKRIISGKIVMPDYTVDLDKLDTYDTDELESKVDSQLYQIMQIKNPVIVEQYFECYRSRFVYYHDTALQFEKTFRAFLCEKIKSLGYSYDYIVDFYSKHDSIEEESDTSSFDSIELRLNNAAQKDPPDRPNTVNDGALNFPDRPSTVNDGTLKDTPDRPTVNDGEKLFGGKVSLETVADEWTEFLQYKSELYSQYSSSDSNGNQKYLLTWYDSSESLCGSTENSETAKTAPTTIKSPSGETLATSESNTEIPSTKVGKKISPLIKMYESYSQY